jgi:hypothetical protein
VTIVVRYAVNYKGNILLTLTCDGHVASVYIAAPTTGRTRVSRSDYSPMAMGVFYLREY